MREKEKYIKQKKLCLIKWKSKIATSSATSSWITYWHSNYSNFLGTKFLFLWLDRFAASIILTFNHLRTRVQSQNQFESSVNRINTSRWTYSFFSTSSNGPSCQLILQFSTYRSWRRKKKNLYQLVGRFYWSFFCSPAAQWFTNQ